MTEFDDIRPYHDEELPVIYEELIADPEFKRVVELVMHDTPFEMIAARMRQCKTKLEFQKAFCYRFLHNIIEKATNGVEINLQAMADRSQAYTYISNHRDIILDSGFLAVMLIENDIDTIEVAIGDNLLIYPWIKKLVRINKSFIVQRALTMKQMLESSARMSRYMHYTIAEKNQSIWISQREGRAKDSNDRTQESVLKMLAMGGEGSLVNRLQSMNIMPLSISYEYDPCDYLKAQEFQLKRDNPNYKKSTADDLKNMETGLFGFKGRVRFKVAPCINDQLAALAPGMSKHDLFREVTGIIDKAIHAGYELFPNNYVAHDMLNGASAFAEYYTADEKAAFSDYVEKQLARIDIAAKDEAYLRQMLLTMYANPLTNYLEAQK